MEGAIFNPAAADNNLLRPGTLWKGWVLREVVTVLQKSLPQGFSGLWDVGIGESQEPPMHIGSDQL